MPRRCSPAPHHWVTVDKRRWCLGCDAFQSKRHGWGPSVAEECPNNTAWAITGGKDLPLEPAEFTRAPKCPAAVPNAAPADNVPITTCSICAAGEPNSVPPISPAGRRSAQLSTYWR